jgi:hypothetical protein
MRILLQLRAPLTIITVVFLIAVLLPGECFGCGTSAGQAIRSKSCCDPDGHCKTSPVPGPRCLQGHPGEIAVVEQAVKVHVLPIAECRLASGQTAPPAEIASASLAEYGPPALHLLHSILLI